MYKTAILRTHMGVIALISWALAMTDARSLAYLIASQREGLLIAGLTGIVGAVALLDAVINDLLPVRFHWRSALQQRHFIILALSFCYGAQYYVASNTTNSTVLLLYYLWNAILLMCVAFVDAHQRSKDATCVIVCST
jgi:hypothetical protein